MTKEQIEEKAFVKYPVTEGAKMDFHYEQRQIWIAGATDLNAELEKKDKEIERLKAVVHELELKNRFRIENEWLKGFS